MSPGDESFSTEMTGLSLDCGPILSFSRIPSVEQGALRA
jgi:hypothetical protein